MQPSHKMFQSYWQPFLNLLVSVENTVSPLLQGVRGYLQPFQNYLEGTFSFENNKSFSEGAKILLDNCRYVVKRAAPLQNQRQPFRSISEELKI